MAIQAQQHLHQSPALPLLVSLSVLQPRHQLIPLHLCSLIRRFDLYFLSVHQLPLLLLHRDQPRLELIPAQYNCKRYLVLLTRRKLGKKLRLRLCQKVRL
jgi:hypothetical protein